MHLIGSLLFKLIGQGRKPARNSDIRPMQKCGSLCEERKLFRIHWHHHTN